MDRTAAEVSLRQVMSRYPTGVTVVAACDHEGVPWGLTVNSFTSVSLEPPLVLVCVDRSASSHDLLVEGGGFAVSVLAADQTEIARRFAASPSEGRFDGVPWCVAPSGSPVLEGSVAWIDCSVHAVHEGGDHSILVGRVEAAAVGDGSALVFHLGTFGTTDT